MTWSQRMRFCLYAVKRSPKNSAEATTSCDGWSDNTRPGSPAFCCPSVLLARQKCLVFIPRECGHRNQMENDHERQMRRVRAPHFHLTLMSLYLIPVLLNSMRRETHYVEVKWCKQPASEKPKHDNWKNVIFWALPWYIVNEHKAESLSQTQIRSWERRNR